MTIKLVNSAMMPQAGRYYMVAIDRQSFSRWLLENEFESYIGYRATADFIQRVVGVDVPMSRKQTVLEDGDIMLVCRLKYRVANPADKGALTPNDDDYEFFLVRYLEYRQATR